MILYGLKKFSKEHQMKIDQGRAYGAFRGYAVSLYEGSGWKALDITCLIPEEEREQELRDILASVDLRKSYRVISLEIKETGVYIRFHDNPGTMKKMLAFIDWFFPLLDQSGATGADICTQCGTKISDDTWYNIGGTAYHMHKSCSERLERLESEKGTLDDEERPTSYLSGTMGAFLGAMLGAVLWGVVYYIGYVASIVGFVIGILASKGYDLMRGRQSRKKLIILVLVSMIAVIFGTLGAYTYELVNLINSGNLAGYSYADIPWMMQVILQDVETLKLIVYDIGLGLLFAFLGLSIVLHKVNYENKDYRPKRLGEE